LIGGCYFQSAFFVSLPLSDYNYFKHCLPMIFGHVQDLIQYEFIC